MENADVQLVVGTLAGVRLIRIVFPPSVSQSLFVATTARYLELWEEDLPTVAVGDVTRLERIDDTLRNVLVVVMRRTSIQPGFIGSAWITGQNRAMHETLRGILVAAGREPNLIFESERRALAYLRTCVIRWRE